MSDAVRRVDLGSPYRRRALRLAVAWRSGRVRVVGAALLGLALLSVMQWRGHALTYLPGGPAIAILTGVLLLAAGVTLLVALLSTRSVEQPVLDRRDRSRSGPPEQRPTRRSTRRSTRRVTPRVTT